MKTIILISFFLALHFHTFGQITGIKISGDTCSNFTLALQAVGTSSSPFFSWNFNDPASGINNTVTITGASPSPFPTHTFSSTGIYNVCVRFQELGSPVSTVCREISIGLCCNGIINSRDACLQNTIPFSITTRATINSISWNFDDPASGASNTSNSLTPTHLFSAAGTFNVRAVVNYSCGVETIFKTLTITDCNNSTDECQLFVPNAFSPNADGINDKFVPLTDCTLEHYECLIFNRWGSIIYGTADETDEWDGKYKGSDASAGICTYLISYKFPSQEIKYINGTITLLR